MDENIIIQQSDNDEIQINLAALAAYIIRKWKLLAICAMVGAILIGGTLSLREAHSIKSRYSDEELTALLETMSDSQKENVRQLYNRYIAYKEQLRYNQIYLENSYLMSLDPNSFSSYVIEYLVESNQSDVIGSFSSLALGKNEYERIAAILGSDIDERFLYEAVSISGGSTEEGMQLDVDNGNDAYIGSVSNRYKGLMKINIEASSKEECGAIAEVAEAAVLMHLDKLTGAGIDVTIQRIADRYTESLSTGLAARQESKIAEGTDLISEFKKFESNYIDTLSTEEKELYSFYVDREDNLAEEHVSWKKYVLIGFALGFVLAGLYLALNYLFGSKLMDVGEIEDKYGISNLGVLFLQDRRNGLDGVCYDTADRIQYHKTRKNRENTVEFLKARIANCCSNNKIKKLFLIMDLENECEAKNNSYLSTIEVVNSLLDSLCSSLSDLGIIVYKGNPALHAEAFQSLAASDGSIYVAVPNYSGKTNADEYISICNETGVRLLGVLTMER